MTQLALRGVRGIAIAAVLGLLVLGHAAPAAAESGRLLGPAPAPGTFGLVVWSGGPVGEIATSADAHGCDAVSAWANRPGGGLVGHIFQAPDFVNRAFATSYGGALPANTPLVLVCAPELAPAPAPVPAGLAADEARMVELVNAARVNAGLPALRVDLEMSAVARAHSRDMAERGYFDHTNPDGESPFDRMRAAGIDYRAAGENIAGNRDVESAHGSLMNSSGHRANILGRDFGRIGIGIAPHPDYGWVFTQLFAD